MRRQRAAETEKKAILKKAGPHTYNTDSFNIFGWARMDFKKPDWEGWKSMDMEESCICHQIISGLCSFLAIGRRRKVSKDRAHNYGYHTFL